MQLAEPKPQRSLFDKQPRRIPGVRRVLEPFYSNMKLAVFARMFCQDVSGNIRPFSCRLNTKDEYAKKVTVYGVAMPDSEDPRDIPTVQQMSVSDYYQMLEFRELLRSIPLQIGNAARRLMERLKEYEANRDFVGLSEFSASIERIGE